MSEIKQDAILSQRLLDAQVGVLGSMLIDPDTVPEVLSRVRDADFAEKKYRLIFQAIQARFRAGQAIDPILVRETLGGGVDSPWTSILQGLMDVTTTAAQVAAQLRIPEDTPIIRIARLCTADGRPAIYCEDVVEKALAKGDYTIQDFKLPIFHFLQRFCGIYPYLDLTDVRPAAADAALAEIFQVPMGTPLLNMEEVDYDIDGRPVFCSSEYFVDGIFRHTVMRKKL